ncbi:hypothetical protein ACH5RR_012555 [Cinchona calisaya]|uniref:DUF4283 domain-containing protein n=1 Tax=Cinchona calisaya TaxID=153742 RepID=A0ABD3A9K6_9GENT
MYKGDLAICFLNEEVENWFEPFNFSLVGRFEHRRPNMELIWKNFLTIGFKGAVSLGLLDHRYVLIRFDIEENFLRSWLKGMWYILEYAMKVFKWTPTFRLNIDSSIVPIWITIQDLPIILFKKRVATTIALTRPRVAKVCVKIDL